GDWVRVFVPRLGVWHHGIVLQGAPAVVKEGRRLKVSLVIALPEHHNVRGILLARHSQCLSIRRPPKIADSLGGKIRDQAARRAVQWLHPKIPYTLVLDGVNQSFPVCAKFWASHKKRGIDAGIRIYEIRR